ncbi:lauroyl-Kdo(2)-lipid IV(A) myristoyltransferase [Escherichia fergusonii]|uniref:lauroyl-Kdo(2)-lipid IV(A) myristoyltransferase n=1 Tax=Escherichia fergusonii TaxID=564 RepID=UPI0022308FBF|nr:lauroyl-Kdo(2)-lipid IV(A) myristoyltransferase [Escherichia fergusonii]
MRKKQFEFIPEFKKSFLLPRYWSTWCGLISIVIFAFIPPSIRDPALGKLGRVVGRLGKNARRRALINLALCFPERSKKECESIVDAMFATALQSIVMLAELVIRGPEKILPRVHWKNKNILEEIKYNNDKVIFLVPHGWCVDLPAMLMAFQNQKMAAMFHNQRNAVLDYTWNVVRRIFGGRLHARNDGIKPFIQSVRQGYWGYYLPDQDHGPEHSEFVDFFATYKATLPVPGRLAKITQAKIIPLFPTYDAKKHILTIEIHTPMVDLSTADDKTIARRINEEIESFIRPNPEQYTWMLKLLKTRKPNEVDPYP